MTTGALESSMAAFLRAFFACTDVPDQLVHPAHTGEEIDPFAQLAVTGVATLSHEVGPLYTAETRWIAATPAMQHAIADHQALEAWLAEALTPAYFPARAVALYSGAGVLLHGEHETDTEPVNDGGGWVSTRALRLGLERLRGTPDPDLSYTPQDIIAAMHPDGFTAGLGGHGGLVDARRAPLVLTIPAAGMQFAMVLSGGDLYDPAQAESSRAILREMAVSPWGELVIHIPHGAMAVAGFAGADLEGEERMDVQRQPAVFDATFDATFW